MDSSFRQQPQPRSPPATASPSSTCVATTLADLDADSLSHCAGFLTHRDVASLGMTSRRLRLAAASDSVWSRLFKERWPWLPLQSGIPGTRDTFYARHASLQQFKFVDPVEMHCSISTASTHYRTNIILKNADIVMAQDVSTVSCSRSSSCVGMARVLGQTVDMRCHDAICYIGAGCSVSAIDIRSMQNIFTIYTYPKRLNCFSLLASKSLICTGCEDKAMLWDIRENKRTPIADLDEGCVQSIHMDRYKIVTGAYHHGPINIWETDSGTLVNSLDCYSLDDTEEFLLSGMAVVGCRIVTAYHNGILGVAHLRDYANCSFPKSSEESWSASKFWEPCGSAIDE